MVGVHDFEKLELPSFDPRRVQLRRKAVMSPTHINNTWLLASWRRHVYLMAVFETISPKGAGARHEGKAASKRLLIDLLKFYREKQETGSGGGAGQTPRFEPGAPSLHRVSSISYWDPEWQASGVFSSCSSFSCCVMNRQPPLPPPDNDLSEGGSNRTWQPKDTADNKEEVHVGTQ